MNEPWIARRALVECPTVTEIPMYDQSKLSELIRFAGVDAGSTVIDVYPGDGDWTRLFSDVVGPKGRVFSFVPAEIADLKPDQVGRMHSAFTKSVMLHVTVWTRAYVDATMW